jgi:hypothetical protein
VLQVLNDVSGRNQLFGGEEGGGRRDQKGELCGASIIGILGNGGCDALRMVRFTDQPIRLIAFLVFGPLLIRSGLRLNDWFVTVFGVLLMLVDGFCILFKEPQRLQFPESEPVV